MYRYIVCPMLHSSWSNCVIRPWTQINNLNNRESNYAGARFDKDKGHWDLETNKLYIEQIQLGGCNFFYV